MNLLFGQDDVVAAWVGKVVGKPFHAPFTAIGVVDSEGTLRGGFVFNTFTGDAVELSLAGKGCVSREVWPAILGYVFGQLKCARLSIHTRRSNKAVTQQAPRLGFKFEGVSRRMYGDEDGLAYSLVKDDLPALRRQWRI